MGGEYILNLVPSKTAEAIRYYQNWIDASMAEFASRRKKLRERRFPILAILGHGRAGKDTAAEYLCYRLGLKYGGSSSTTMLRFVARMVNLTEEQAWAERHEHREYWLQAGHAIRGSDLTLLCRLCLSISDMAIGLRGRVELHGCVSEQVVDYLVWIDNPRVPPDSTVEFGPEDCDLMIPNHGSSLEFYRKLDRFASLLPPVLES